MAAVTLPTDRRETLTLPIKPAERVLVDRAAEEALMDQTLFVVTPTPTPSSLPDWMPHLRPTPGFTAP